MIAALFVAKGGCYFGLPNVDPWDEARDARLYAGPWPVVAHPPCARWCRLAPLVQKTHGYRVGDDGGCFESALSAVRLFGGVLEHPQASYAFARHNLGRPVRGQWTATECGGWTTEVAQANYGHRAAKWTWLYAHGVVPAVLDWTTPDRGGLAYVTDGGGRIRRRGVSVPRDAKRLSAKAASATPAAFRDLLVSIAESSRAAQSTAGPTKPETGEAR